MIGCASSLSALAEIGAVEPSDIDGVIAQGLHP